MTGMTSRILSRGATIAIIVIASLALLASIAVGAMRLQPPSLLPSYEVTVAAPLEQRPDLGAEGAADIQFTGVSIAPFDPDPTATALDTTAILLRTLVAVAACVVMIVLAVSLRRRRAFGTGTIFALGALAALMLVTAVLAPAFERMAVAATVSALGLPTEGGDGVETWVVPPAFTPQDTDWTLVVLGLVAAMCTWMLVRGRRAERETEGLI